MVSTTSYTLFVLKRYDQILRTRVKETDIYSLIQKPNHLQNSSPNRDQSSKMLYQQVFFQSLENQLDHKILYVYFNNMHKNASSCSKCIQICYKTFQMQLLIAAFVITCVNCFSMIPVVKYKAFQNKKNETCKKFSIMHMKNLLRKLKIFAIFSKTFQNLLTMHNSISQMLTFIKLFF